MENRILKMKYKEYTIEVADDQDREILIADLGDLSFDSFAEEDRELKAYILEDKELERHDEIERFLCDTKRNYRVEELPDQDWNAVWESNFEPIDVAGRCRIRAPFHPKNPESLYDIVIMPKMAFGTGHHATTYLMADEIMHLNLSGLSGLDMGSGTAVLSILAVLCGAAHVDAIDIDEWAYRNGTENIQGNRMQDAVNVELGDASLLAGRHYDFVLANINRNILLSDMGAYASTLSFGGILLVSGILEADVPAIVGCAEKFGLKKEQVCYRNGWAVVQFVMRGIDDSVSL